ncbi:MAG: PfkB family carbohydrate kinase [Candidatus Sumerlaeota bacterium]|nr:PfkB family carbohydrate kinase [Candidatus Sumerlaeota bacterium]
MRDIQSVSIAVIGDFCLDVYWFVDESRREMSLETGIGTSPVANQRISLGGAGNVVNNLAAMDCGNVHAYGIAGDDLWGYELRRQLELIHVDAAGMLISPGAWSTLVYVKPHIGGRESNRFDFGNFNQLEDAAAGALLRALEESLDRHDIVIVNQQVMQGVHTPHMRAALADLIRRRPDRRFIVDSRHFSDSYPGASLKINDHEAVRIVGRGRPSESIVPRHEAVQAAQEIHRMARKPVFVTRGARGCIIMDEDGLKECHGIQFLNRTDTVGAGDSMLAGIGAALAAGRGNIEAAMLGNFVASVTVQKLYCTGTATPEEIIETGDDPDYIYFPDLADDRRNARFAPETDFEIVGRLHPPDPIQYAIFDHDGTISTVREGWEKVMEPVMVRAILGPRYDSADEALYQQVVARVRDFINRTTGIQTIVQMVGLVGMVREFGCVPEGEILDEFGYKRLYNDALMDVVRKRIDKLRKGELGVEDLTLKNAVALLHRLHDAGVKLILASGTDEEDVKAEAAMLGYAVLFDGGIYGSVGNVKKDAKKVVLERILQELGPGAMRGLATFGDGPVEIRETHKRGGFAVGVLSDEVRRFGINPDKRARLVQAGADLIIPDFTQLGKLLEILGLS